MPNDVKAIVSVVTLLAALIFAYWEATVAQAVPAWFVIGFAVFAVLAMWIFPEAGVKKSDMPPKERR
jgi:apolipoprotein N-acyltransferase